MRLFMIQGCPTLICIVVKYFFHEVYTIGTLLQCMNVSNTRMHYYLHIKNCGQTVIISTTVASYAY